MVRPLILLALACSFFTSDRAIADEARKPFGPIQVYSQRFRPVLLQEGKLLGLFVHPLGSGRSAVAWVASSDNGRTWGERRVVAELPETDANDAWADLVPLVDSQNDNLHVFLLKWEQRDKRFPTRRLGAWHMRAELPYQEWTKPKQLFDGYIGALMSTAQLTSGTLVLPFAYMTDRHFKKPSDGLEGYVYMGQHTATVVYSTDGGGTFHKSPSDLNVPTPNLETYGAVEPVCLALKDGAWMLIRTQMGRQWESFSDDGIHWSEPEPSRFISSDSPVSLTRLRDGRIVIIWNNCLRYPYAYGGRHVLHAALSDDDGVTWQGFREVFRDPRRKQPAHPISGDYGTAYSFTAPTKDGKMIFSTGQGETAGVFLLDPDWLAETTGHEDFSRGLENWSKFGTKGVELVAHPDSPTRQALAIQRTDEAFPAGAVWNFPNGRRGTVRVRFRLLAGPAATSITLTDHFSTPFDKEAELNGLFTLTLAPGQRLPDGTRLETKTSYDLALQWDFANRLCKVTLNDQLWQELPQLKLGSAGANYLRFRALSDEPTPGGLLVESVSATVMPSR